MRLERAPLIALAAALAVSQGCATSQTPAGTVKNEGAASQREEAARVHAELGKAYLEQGKLDVALEKLNQSLSFDADYADAHTLLGVLYERINDQAKAEEHYKRAAQLRPKAGAELNNYGTFLCKSGRYNEAETYFQRALADPFYKTPAVALSNSGTCLLRAGKRDQAETVLRQSLDRDPNDAEALIQLASVLYEKGDYLKARAFVQRFETVKSPRPDALLLGRNIELHLGDSRGAGDYTHRLLQGFPESEQAHWLSSQR
ncbi:MAG: type IV pilus biogenesis/stability protein PilW [Rhodanobacter sp.]|jgi:type IV pilus assembly protein PilF|nr:type IV pilus biogenesis/stability protein PilW [Rhodanobacter sp.]